MKNPFTYIIIAVLLVVALFFVYNTITGKAINSSDLDSFAQCLTDEGAIMYGTTWCSYCNRQKDEFGSSFKNINFVDCDRSKEECVLAGVTGYPTWKIKGQLYPGLQSLDRLSSASGCPLS